MSKNSLKYNFNEAKYNLKTIIYLFILLDVPLYFAVSIQTFLWIIATEFSLIFGLLLGIKGQGNFKTFMFNLRAIAEDPLYNAHEEVRGHKLKQEIHYATLAWDAWFFKKPKESKKKTRNSYQKSKTRGEKSKMRIDEVVWKQIGYVIVGIWGFLGVALLDTLLNVVYLSVLWTLTIEGIWYTIDAFILFYVHYIFNYEPIVEKPIEPLIMNTAGSEDYTADSAPIPT
jgi:hypothetical protein